MDSAKVWRLILLRGIWFMVAVGLILLGIIFVVEGAGGRPAPSGVEYVATVTAKSSVRPPAADGTVCRVTVDPSSAPEQSDAPTRLRSATPCSELPVVGQGLRLTYVEDGRTVVTNDAGPAGGPSIWLGIVAVIAGIAFLGLFVRANRQFTHALDEVVPPAQRHEGAAPV